GPALLEMLDDLEPAKSSENKPLRFPLQDVYKFEKQRIFAGRVESGRLSAGEEVLFLPSGKTGRVKSIEKWNAPVQRTAGAGESIGVTLEDQIFVERGETVCHASSRPQISDVFLANIFWMGGAHLERGSKYLLRLAAQEVECVVDSIQKVINSSTLEELSKTAHEVAKNEVAEVILRAKKPVAFDSFEEIPETGRFVLIHNHVVSGGGIILRKAEPVVVI
ncbi:MAG: adenylyl-sulfate kinase, partial [Candidatus Omnitrophica bacterium]|nr:adenylyl-sulfate kinase [Candidatus Omnitrophota bacterium]